MAHPYEAFEKPNDYDEPIINLRENGFLFIFNSKPPDRETTNDFIEDLNLTTLKELTKF